jgi:hypothetical protein
MEPLLIAMVGLLARCAALLRSLDERVTGMPGATIDELKELRADLQKFFKTTTGEDMFTPRLVQLDDEARQIEDMHAAWAGSGLENEGKVQDGGDGDGGDLGDGYIKDEPSTQHISEPQLAVCYICEGTGLVNTPFIGKRKKACETCSGSGQIYVRLLSEEAPKTGL